MEFKLFVEFKLNQTGFKNLKSQVQMSREAKIQAQSLSSARAGASAVAIFNFLNSVTLKKYKI